LGKPPRGGFLVLRELVDVKTVLTIVGYNNNSHYRVAAAFSTGGT
jgi:hypothetical protein